MLLDYTNRGGSKMSKRLKVKQDEEYSVKELMENFISEKRAEGRSIQKKAIITVLKNSSFALMKK